MGCCARTTARIRRDTDQEDKEQHAVLRRSKTIWFTSRRTKVILRVDTTGKNVIKPTFNFYQNLGRNRRIFKKYE